MDLAAQFSAFIYLVVLRLRSFRLFKKKPNQIKQLTPLYFISPYISLMPPCVNTLLRSTYGYMAPLRSSIFLTLTEGKEVGTEDNVERKGAQTCHGKREGRYQRRMGGVSSGKLVLCQQQGLLFGAALLHYWSKQGPVKPHCSPTGCTPEIKVNCFFYASTLINPANINVICILMCIHVCI